MRRFALAVIFAAAPAHADDDVPPRPTPTRVQAVLDGERAEITARFDVTTLDTGPFRDQPRPEHEWVKHLLTRYKYPLDLRGDGIYAVGRKAGPVRDRYPDWLYQ